MRIFNLAEELEKERKKNKELENYREGYRKEIDYWRIQYSNLQDKLYKIRETIKLRNQEMTKLLYIELLEILEGSDNNDK